jgi:hypothetical protein
VNDGNSGGGGGGKPLAEGLAESMSLGATVVWMEGEGVGERCSAAPKCKFTAMDGSAFCPRHAGGRSGGGAAAGGSGTGRKRGGELAGLTSAWLHSAEGEERKAKANDANPNSRQRTSTPETTAVGGGGGGGGGTAEAAPADEPPPAKRRRKDTSPVHTTTIQEAVAAAQEASYIQKVAFERAAFDAQIAYLQAEHELLEKERQIKYAEATMATWQLMNAGFPPPRDDNAGV